MKTFLAAFCILAVSLFSSCQRNLGDDPLPIVNSQDSIYLSRYYELTSANDTPLLAVFSYDSQKRLVEIRSKGYLAPRNSIANFPFHLVQKRYYHGNDTLPYGASSTDLSTEASTFYFYDANGWIVKDSSESRIVTWTNLGSNNFRSIRRRFLGGWTLDTVWSSRTLQNGNFIGGYDSTLTNPWPSIAHYYQKIWSVATFDTKVNPFQRLHIRYSTPHDQAFHNHTDDFFPKGVNNPLTYQWRSLIWPADVTKLREYTYTYNSRNLPVTIKATENGSPMFHFGFYEYTAL